ncbi:MAG TPA: DUF2163 domain-containing protein [Steroidobacteraceae bacterium]|nr:DUF2163 domain-containing protein [Steroidobacteraceae bacterium]
MRQLSTADTTLLAGRVTTLAECWYVAIKNYDPVLVTGHDRDVVVTRGPVAGITVAGTYLSLPSIFGKSLRSSSALDVDNAEVDVLLSSVGVTIDDIRAGLWDNVRFVHFLVNWTDPTDSGIVLGSGTVGNIRSFAQGLATSELRGLSQQLQKNILEQTSLSCRAELGDTRCGVNLAGYTVTGIVDAVTSRRVFDALLDLGSPAVPPGYFVAGVLTFTSGDNAGYSRRVKIDSAGSPSALGHFELYENFPLDIEEGDTFTVSAGCNKQHSVDADGGVAGDCYNKFDNLLNFRGEPFIPGQYAIYSGA